MINPRKITQSYSTLSEAKAAAQRDFEQRVKECLDLKAQQKQALIDMMRGDEELGLYDEFG
jgi:polysaccharide pyruvyl transferase WcaK-like protein